MPNLFSVPAGASIAIHAAQHVLATVPREQLARAVLLLPTRRACVTMRQTFQEILGGEVSLLPRMLPLADMDQSLLTLLGESALTVMESIQPAMEDWQQRYLLTTQVMQFERRRMGAATLDDALALAEQLMALHNDCARAGVQLTPEKLRPLAYADFATHWEQSLLFLGILAEHWPLLEQELGLTTQPNHEVAVLAALTSAWKTSPPDFPVIAIGSTASQESTAKLLTVIADMPHGAVILPGLDPSVTDAEWQTIAPGHPLHHLKHFLDRWPVAPSAVKPLTRTARSVWMDALAATDQIPHWKTSELAPYDHITLVPCAHAEEEARVIALLLRESLEKPATRTALVTPDEGLMAQVSAHMRRYGVAIDRLQAGTLATTQTGSLWAAAMAAITNPQRLLMLRALLHHPLMQVDADFLQQLEPYWYGVSTHRVGQLPKLPEALRAHPAMPSLLTLVRELARLQRTHLSASAWVQHIEQLLAPYVPQSGVAHDAIAEATDMLAHADMLGSMGSDAFQSLLAERLAQSWRKAELVSHPQLFMLTPVEARLQQFDRIILANMQEAVWPGITTPNAWLNLAAQKALGLPVPEERISLMAHDVLMLASSGEVFLTYPKRDGGSPAARSRFIERLVTFLAMHGVAESAITEPEYAQWAKALDEAEHFSPASEVKPLPIAEQRPTKIPASALDLLFTDPYTIYARYVLKLRKLDEIDAEPEASDFGSLAHAAIQALTLHWNDHARAATSEEIAGLADTALRDFSDRPNVALFWRTRLLRALAWVNDIESKRRLSAVQVSAEVVAEAQIASVTLHGRIDRLEQGQAGNMVVDYKTGTAPTVKKILSGEALQLLAYAMIIENTKSLEYWALPRSGVEGEITHLPIAELIEAGIPEKLRDALADMLNPATPFLARPIPTTRDARFGNDYDGISRYDEWAG